MKVDLQGIVADLKAKALPIAEKDLIVVVDTVIGSVRNQAGAQAGDAVASVVALVLGAVQPAIDAELSKILPDAAKA